MSCLLFFFLCENVKKKCPCVIYIYLYTCTHTFSCRPHSFLCRAREPLRVKRLDRTRRRPSHAPQSRSDILAIAQPFCSSKPYHDSLHFSISISRKLRRRRLGHVTVVIVVPGRTTRSLISCKPSVLGLELRPHAHYVVYYLNTNTLALAPGSREKHTCSGGM